MQYYRRQPALLLWAKALSRQSRQLSTLSEALSAEESFSVFRASLRLSAGKTQFKKEENLKHIYICLIKLRFSRNTFSHSPIGGYSDLRHYNHNAVKDSFKNIFSEELEVGVGTEIHQFNQTRVLSKTFSIQLIQ